MRYLAFLLGILVFLAGCVDQTQNSANIGNNTFTLDKATEQELTQILKDLVFVQSGGRVAPKSVNVVEVKDLSGVILVNFSVDGQYIPIYITKDKQYLVGGLIKISDFKRQLNDAKARLSGSNVNTTADQIIQLSQDYEFVGPYEGNNTARIIVVEFSDFECPFCGRFYRETLPNIKENWINTNKIGFYYRHLPLVSLHPKAMPAAIASYCADQQGKFWEAHDWLFENIDRFTNGTNMAEAIGLNLTQFNECISSQEARDYVNNDLQLATGTFGITGTPGFIVVVPKSVGLQKVQQAANIVRGKVYETPNQYIIVFTGAYPYPVFNQLLTTLEN